MLMKVEKGLEDRVCINIPPRHGKSLLTSTYFPAWYIGRNPNKKLLMVSHTTDLAVDFGRKVRNLIDSPEYQQIFPNVKLAKDSKSAGRWNTVQGAEFFACGVGSALAGRGADLLLIDDPHNEQDIINGKYEVFDKAYEWFTYGARTRLMPQGRIINIQCMTGDTPVLRPDGSNTPLGDLRPGDSVASFDNGRLVAATVLKHKSNGLDSVFTIKTTSSIVVRANERHPFLVIHEGELKWVRLKNLQTGDTLVSLRAVTNRLEQKHNPVNAGAVCPLTHTIESIPMPPVRNQDITVSGMELFVQPMAAKKQQGQKVFAENIIVKPDTLQDLSGVVLQRTAKPILSTATVSRWKSTIAYLRSRADAVRCAISRQVAKILVPIGTVSSVWTIATNLVGSVHYSATIATSLSDTQKLKPSLSRLQSIYELTQDTIESITPAGIEEVFDIQVEGTENFIANGLVSHNTRWHSSDLTGRLVQDMQANEQADQYHEIGRAHV